MKRVIFTSYDDLKTNDLSKLDSTAKNQIAEYFDRLVENKKSYAHSINVDFKLYHNTMKDFFVSNELEFTKVNLYKHHLMHELAKEYDEVMYVDMDVVFNTTKNVFKELELDKGIHILDQDEEIISKNINELLFKQLGLRNSTLKYHITKDGKFNYN